VKEFFTPFKVGVVVLVGLAAFIFMLGKVREGIDAGAAGYHVYADFRDATGLVKKSRVVIAGISVGEIDRIELVGDKARVWLLVNTPLRSDATVAKRQASLLGESYLELTPGVKGTPLKDGDEIKIVLSDVAPADLMNELKAIADNVNDITRSLRDVVSTQEGQQKIAGILDNVSQITARVNKMVADNSPKVDRVLDNITETSADAREFAREFRSDARVILEDARAVTHEVRGIIGKSKGDVEEGFDGVKGAVRRLQAALDKADATLAHTESISRKIDEGQGTIGKLINDDHTINSVNELVDETGHFVKQITRLQTIVGLRSEYYLGATAVKNYFSLALQPHPDKYYLLQLVDDPRGKVTHITKVVNTTESDEDPVSRKDETITEDKFRFSLEFAKRFYFVTGRIGIIENTGGVGLDLHFFDDSLQLSADLFAFDENVNPRLKAWAEYTFFTHLYIAAGIDDVWNDELTDFFVGAEIRFNDEDLKAIFTAAPKVSF
jgi:phospholipid/cholesterol/gamma-HCH transport system substrate-binding protein